MSVSATAINELEIKLKDLFNLKIVNYFEVFECSKIDTFDDLKKLVNLEQTIKVILCFDNGLIIFSALDVINKPKIEIMFFVVDNKLKNFKFVIGCDDHNEYWDYNQNNNYFYQSKNKANANKWNKGRFKKIFIKNW